MIEDGENPPSEPQEPEPTPTENDPPSKEPAKEPSLLDDGPEPSFDDTPVEAEAVIESLNLPEGVETAPEKLTPFIELINNAQSRQEIVTEGLKLLAEQHVEMESAITEQWQTVQDAWREEARKDPEVGGENFEKSLATAKELIQTYADDDKSLKELFTLTGVGNSVHMIKFLNRLAAEIPGKATPVEGTTQPTSATRADKLFGSV